MEGGSYFTSRQLVRQNVQSLLELTRLLKLYCRDSLKSSSFVRILFTILIDILSCA